MRICRHCSDIFAARVGRGLCRKCWNQPAVRKKYGPIAKFGGATTGSHARAWEENEEAWRRSSEKNASIPSVT